MPFHRLLAMSLTIIGFPHSFSFLKKIIQPYINFIDTVKCDFHLKLLNISLIIILVHSLLSRLKFHRKSEKLTDVYDVLTCLAHVFFNSKRS